MPYLWVPPAATKGRLLVADGTSWQPLTVGSNNQVLTADSAESTGVKWAAASGGGSGAIVDHDEAARTAGNVIVTATSWTAVDTGIDLTVNASEGDLLDVALSSAWFDSDTDAQGQLVAATMVSSSPVNYINGVSGGGNGVTGWRCVLNDSDMTIGASVRYVVQAGDLSGGSVTLRLLTAVSAGDAALVANSNFPLQWSVVNLGQ